MTHVALTLQLTVGGTFLLAGMAKLRRPKEIRAIASVLSARLGIHSLGPHGGRRGARSPLPDAGGDLARERGTGAAQPDRQNRAAGRAAGYRRPYPARRIT